MRQNRCLWLIVGWLLTACASQNFSLPAVQQTETVVPYPAAGEAFPTTAFDGEPYPAPVGETSFTVQDALGRIVPFSAPPQRVVIAGKALFMLADAVYLFPQARDRVVALGSASQGTGNFIALIDPQYAQKTTLAGDAGAEQIAAYQPDLVLLKSYLAESLGAPLETLGIPVVYLDLETPEQYQRDLTILGEVFQDPARADEIKAFYQSRVNHIQQRVQGAPKPTVLLLQYNDKDGKVAFYVPPQNWMQTILTDLAGGQAVWRQIELGKGWTQVSLEQIAAWDADKIFVISYFRNAAEVVNELRQDPNWQAMRAVKQGNLFGFAADLYSWDQPDVRWILGLSWLAAQLHPTLFADYDVRQEMVDFYQTLYGLDENFVNQEILPSFTGEIP